MSDSYTAAEIYDAINTYLENMQHNYIGMKYVTTFSDPIDWSSENQYEQLTITRGTNGHYYVSRQFVPEGVLITDTDFWLDFFEVDEAIEDYLSVNGITTENIVDGAVTADKLDSSLPTTPITTDEIDTIMAS